MGILEPRQAEHEKCLTAHPKTAWHRHLAGVVTDKSPRCSRYWDRLFARTVSRTMGVLPHTALHEKALCPCFQRLNRMSPHRLLLVSFSYKNPYGRAFDPGFSIHKKHPRHGECDQLSLTRWNADDTLSGLTRVVEATKTGRSRFFTRRPLDAGRQRSARGHGILSRVSPSVCRE